VNDKKQENNPVEETISAAEMVELKRDMQSAKVTDWLQKNQQQIIAVAIVFVLALVGFSLWKEQQITQKSSAALLYMKATNMTDDVQRMALLDTLINDYANTGYATLAQLQKIKTGDAQTKEASLKLLVNSKGAPELVWQARLDLAELLINKGKIEEAAKVLEERLGKQYEQARYALLSTIASDKSERVTLIQKSLDATSNDNNLKVRLEAELALLRAEK
jgi:predicted negative regulator of RcsB-dependent stress response